MAEVWEGRDEVLSRPVALKLLLPHLAADPVLQERFRREAVTAARLVHPGIVAIFDAGVEPLDGTAPLPQFASGTRELDWAERPSTAFIVMELVPGETLRDLVRRCGPMDPRLVTAVVSQVADALSYAHSQGLVHRDIKPANVLLRDGGAGLVQVKVADFGIAKATASRGDLTAEGALLGTPKYVSPEQVQGREPDARADLYSLGVVMFEMLAGRAPLEEGTDMATALAHVQRPAPSLADARPGLPRPLVDLVASLLVKEPEQRVASAADLLQALAELGKDLGAPANGPGAFLHLGPAARSSSARTAAPTGTLTDSVSVTGQSLPSATLREDRSGPPPATRSGRARRRRQKRFASAVVAGLLAGGSAVAVALLYPGGLVTSPPGHAGGRTPGGKGAATYAGAEEPLKVVTVKELTTGGNLPNDNLNELPNLTSNNPSTYWQSEIYKGPRFGNYGGLGLALELNGTHILHNLVVKTPMQDWSAEVFVGDRFVPWGSWGKPTSSQDQIYSDHTFSLGGKKGSWVLFWMLSPGPSYKATVDKLSVN
jgi:serine/threonine-protein kinase